MEFLKKNICWNKTREYTQESAQKVQSCYIIKRNIKFFEIVLMNENINLRKKKDILLVFGGSLQMHDLPLP